MQNGLFITYDANMMPCIFLCKYTQKKIVFKVSCTMHIHVISLKKHVLYEYVITTYIVLKVLFCFTILSRTTSSGRPFDPTIPIFTIHVYAVLDKKFKFNKELDKLILIFGSSYEELDITYFR